MLEQAGGEVIVQPAGLSAATHGVNWRDAQVNMSKIRINELARELEKRGAHILAIKDMAGLCRPYAAARLVKALREELVHWCVDEPWFADARPDCKLMHCLPVRRGVAVADRILDGPRSIVLKEARNRLYVQMAVLYRMMKA